MLIKKDLSPRTQMEIAALDDLVPENHLVRQVEAAINLEFIYPIVEPTYSKETGRPSIDPVVLIKLVMLQHLFGIPSIHPEQIFIDGTHMKAICYFTEIFTKTMLIA